MFNLIVKANTPVGQFTGRIDMNAFDTFTDAATVRDTLQDNINKLQYMVLFSNTNDDQISLPENVIKNSVLTFSIVEAK